MIGELFQQQAKRLEVQLYQQLRDKKQIELVHTQLMATTSQLQTLQSQNAQQRKLISANEENVISIYEHARKVQHERNQLARICEQLSFDIRTLRQALSEECPERYGHYVNQSVERLPQLQTELPPLEEILPQVARESGSHSGDSNAPKDLQNHAETALALLSTVASRTSDERKFTDHNGSESGSSDRNGSSNNGTEDTVSFPQGAGSSVGSGRGSERSGASGSKDGSDKGSDKDSSDRDISSSDANGSEANGSEGNGRSGSKSNGSDSNGSDCGNGDSEGRGNGSDCGNGDSEGRGNGSDCGTGSDCGNGESEQISELGSNDDEQRCDGSDSHGSHGTEDAPSGDISSSTSSPRDEEAERDAPEAEASIVPSKRKRPPSDPPSE